MNVTIYTPTDPLLQQYIECFYILSQQDKKEVIAYITFPSINTIVSILDNAVYSVKGNQVTASCNTGTIFTSSIVARFREPIYFIYEGHINEITIYFKPLGISFFLDHPLTRYSKTDFNLFNPYPDYTTAMLQVLKHTDDTVKMQLLENYWLSKLKAPKQQLQMQDIVNAILQNNEAADISLQQLANDHNLSRKTIHKYFVAQVGKTPSEFKKTQRFRQAVTNRLTATNQVNLTNVAYDAQYFDQSHMIKDFKVLTGQNPKIFFNKTSIIKQKEKIFWQFR